MSAFVARANVPPFASADFRSGMDSEVRAAFSGFFAYFGNYTFDLSAGVVTHHLHCSSFPNWTGTKQVRYFKVEGELLVLSTPITEGGRHLIAILTWERATER